MLFQCSNCSLFSTNNVLYLKYKSHSFYKGPQKLKNLSSDIVFNYKRIRKNSGLTYSDMKKEQTGTTNSIATIAYEPLLYEIKT